MASAWVVLFHLNEPIAYVDNPYRAFVKYGALGVPIFFVVSGYCIAMAAQDCKNPFEFYTRRFFRIFPMYWFSLLVVMGCVIFHLCLFGQNPIVPLPTTVKEVAATLSLMTRPFTSTITVNWVYWSLTVEIFFYLVVGLGLFLNKRFRFLFLVSVSVLAFIPNMDSLRALFFIRDWAQFGMGIGLFGIFHEKKYKTLSWVLLIVNFFALYSRHQFDSWAISGFCGVAAIAISLLWSDLPKNPVSRLGDYAYSVYLIHVPIGVYIMGLLKTAFIQKNIVYNILFDLGVLALMLFLGLYAFKYLEIPAINFGKKLSKKIYSKRPLTPMQVS